MFYFRIRDLRKKSNRGFSVKSLAEIGTKIFNIPGIVLSCSYFKQIDGIDVYEIRNVYAGNFVMGYSTINLE